MPAQSRAASLGEHSSVIAGKKNDTNLQNLVSAIQQLKPSVLLAESFVFFLLPLPNFQMIMLCLHLEMEFLDVNIMINAEDFLI